MRLERWLRVSLFTLTGASTLALCVSLGSVAWLGFGVASLLCCMVLARVWPGWHPSRDVSSTAVILVTLVFFVEVVGTQMLLVPAAHFLLVIQVVWLMQEGTSRQCGWVVLTSLVQMVVAGVLSVDLVFGACLVVYVLAGVFALMLLNLRRELERAGDKRAEARISTRLVACGAFVGVGELVVIVLVFLYFPRFGLQLLQLRPLARGPALTGISDRVRLGDLAEILDNPEVVMSVRLFRNGRPLRATSFRPYWRGMGLDTYEAGVWRTRHYIGELGGYSLRYRTFRPYVRKFPGMGVTAEVALEPVATRVLFYLPRLVELTSGTPNLDGVFYHAPTRSVSSTRSTAVSLRYYVRARVPQWPVEELRRPVAFDPTGRREEWLRGLQLPPGLDPRVRGLAESIVAHTDKFAFYDRARLIETYLKGHYDYTLHPGRVPPGEDPVVRFLFTTRRGHCEYFAAAMVLMLRTLGIPARMATGFVGGEWNDYGRFYVVRQRNAHAWVEVYVPSVRDWVTFDPTPRSDMSEGGGYGWVAALDRRLAYLRLAWNNYVVNYSFQDQRALSAALNRLLGHLAAVMRPVDGRLTVRGAGRGALGALALVVAGPLGAVLAVYLLRLAARRLRRSRLRAARPALGFYRKLESLLRRHGFRREPSTTPREFARHVVLRGGPSYEPVVGVVEAFCRVRYGGERLGGAERRAIHRALARLQRLPRPGSRVRKRNGLEDGVEASYDLGH